MPRLLWALFVRGARLPGLRVWYPPAWAGVLPCPSFVLGLPRYYLRLNSPWNQPTIPRDSACSLEEEDRSTEEPVAEEDWLAWVFMQCW